MKNRPFIIAGLLLTAFLFTGCSSKNMITDDNRNQLIRAEGYDVSPPTFLDWTYFQSDHETGFFYLRDMMEEEELGTFTTRASSIRTWLITTQPPNYETLQELAQRMEQEWRSNEKVLQVEFESIQHRTANLYGHEVEELQLIGSHDIPGLIYTQIARFQARVYLLEADEYAPGTRIAFLFWDTRLFQGMDQTPPITTKWEIVEQMIGNLVLHKRQPEAPLPPTRPAIRKGITIDSYTGMYRFSG